MGELVEQLKCTPLGDTIDASQALELVEAATAINISTGHTLFMAGDPGDALYIILEGSLEVVLGRPPAGTMVVATVGPGHIIGELEVMTGSLRAATLLATTDSVALRLDKLRFESLLAQNSPAATCLLNHMAKTLARRLAAVNQRIVAKLPKAPPQNLSVAPIEINDDDLMPMDVTEDDLDVLDKLWS